MNYKINNYIIDVDAELTPEQLDQLLVKVNELKTKSVMIRLQDVIGDM